jgi:hypothetical protein
VQLFGLAFRHGSYQLIAVTIVLTNPPLALTTNRHHIRRRPLCPGMQRFSEPRCEPLGRIGSPCRMWQEPENKTLHFPSSILLCNNVYTQFCPCGPGLVCHEAECRPVQVAGKAGQADRDKDSSPGAEQDVVSAERVDRSAD